MQTDLQTKKNFNQKSFKAGVQQWDHAEKERQIQTLKKKNEKQAEILQFFNKSMEALKTQLSHSEKSRDELSRKIEVFTLFLFLTLKT